MAEIALSAPAKLNLILRVGPLAPDGYHPLESLLVTLGAPCDRVRVGVSAGERVVESAEAPGPDNLAWAALDAFERATGIDVPLYVKIDKRIPAKAGLGGGSSDAAATLRAANEIHGRPLDRAALEGVAADVGSDVPFFIRGGAQWARGRGEALTPTSMPADLNLAVIDGGVELSTAAVYRAVDELEPDELPAPDDRIPAGPVWEWSENYLWPAAQALAPALDRMDRELREAGAQGTLLCGSGGSMAGMFATPSDLSAAHAALESTYPTWTTRTASPHVTG